MYSSAARTNIDSRDVDIDRYSILGEGQFRIAYAGTYNGGNRNGQEAVCKEFKPKYSALEDEFYEMDAELSEKAIFYAEESNKFCKKGKEIQISYGAVMELGMTKYMVEPLIRYFQKFTSNSGWIASEDDVGWAVLAMEAFSHFTYHRSGGNLIVCDLQGRHRYDRFNRNKCRFELTDVAICSRSRRYGITDMGEKGIETFFHNHCCNKFCHSDGNTWARPRAQRSWFESNSATSMIRSTQAHLLDIGNSARFTSTLQPIYDEDSDDDY